MKKYQTYIIIIAVVGIIGTVWLTSKNHHKQKLQIELLKQNEANRRINDERLAKKDTTISTLLRQTLSKSEFKNWLNTNNKELKHWITKENKINLRKVTSVINSTLVYVNRDTTIVDLSELKDLILNSKNGKISFRENIENCMIIGGYVLVDGDKIDLVIDDKQFKNTMKGVAYIQRQKWKLLFFNTRLFGKRKLELILTDSCGVSHTLILDISKRKK